MAITICVSGHSDDLIEVDGDVRLEATADVNDTGTVVVNGTDLLKVTYDNDGLWRVQVIGQVPGVDVQLFHTPGEDRDRTPTPPYTVAPYSDYALVTGDLTSVEVEGERWTRP